MIITNQECIGREREQLVETPEVDMSAGNLRKHSAMIAVRWRTDSVRRHW